MRKTILTVFLIFMCSTSSIMAPATSVVTMAASTKSVTHVAKTTDTKQVVASELTGLPINGSLASQRPVALMMDNDTRALPHYGLAEADVVYEMMNSTANNRVTRLMAVYKDWYTVNQIGNIRSTRPTNIMLASEWNAILIHDGGPFYNNPYFKSTKIAHLSGGFSRVKNGKATEFTEYAKGTDISKKAKTAKISASYTNDQTKLAAQTHWSFGTTDMSAYGLPGIKVKLSCFKLTKPELLYNAKTETYDYYENGKISQDGEDKQVVSFKNVILQECTFHQYDKNGYLIYNIIGEGNGYYLTGGKMIPITWKKASETGATKYYDAAGREITLNCGKTYVGICPSDDWKNVSIS